MMIAGCNEDLILSRCRCTSSLKDTFQDAKLAARRLMVEDEVVSLLRDSQLSNIKFLMHVRILIPNDSRSKPPSHSKGASQYSYNT
jgi:hypothetical protein